MLEQEKERGKERDIEDATTNNQFSSNIFLSVIVVVIATAKPQNSSKKLIPIDSFFLSFKNMAIGEKVFEHSGKVTGFKVTKVNSIDGIVTETSFVTELKGFGKKYLNQKISVLS